MARVPVTGSRHLLPFDRLSPADFERLCLWLVRRESYRGAEYLGEAGSEQGRDVVAWKDGKRFAFQCKRVQLFTAADAKKEIAKIRGLPAAEQPAELVFVVSKAVGAATREKTRKVWGDEASCHFWAGAELDERVKRHDDLVAEFFQLPPQPSTAVEDGEQGDEDAEKAVLSLRIWPASELPDQPYPVLLPYTHPELMAGREAEVRKLRLRLRMPVPILGLGAASGTGKSSLLLGGLVPALRSEGAAVAVVRHPQEAGVAGRLLGDLVEGLEPIDDGDWPGFVAGLAAAGRLAGEAPLLVLDQFEGVLRAAAARVRLGVLLAATTRRRPGTDEPLCRWLLAYRVEFHGELLAWLEDVLVEARARGDGASAASLPHDLSGTDRFHELSLTPFATPPPAGDALAEITRVFQAAIEKPLTVPGSDGGPRYPFRFATGQAWRLAAAFAETRLARPAAPLVPELQVVLAHLLAASDGTVEVPEDPGELIGEALADHLRRALEAAYPAATEEAATRRARALLALRELATAGGERGEGMAADEVARAIGDDGEAVLEQLATPLTRLVVLRRFPGGLRWVLSHDRMAEVVADMVDQGRHGDLPVDGELLALRRFVGLKTALHEAREEAATRVPPRHYRRIAAHADALLRDDARRGWWAACRERRRTDRRRSAVLAGAALVFLLLVSWGTWSTVRWLRAPQARSDHLARSEPGLALEALVWLLDDGRVDAEDLLALLRERPSAMDVLERGLGQIPEERRSAVVLEVVELALPWVAQAPDDPVLIANLVWALDFAPARDPPHAARAQLLRDRVLAPLRELRPLPAIADEDWVDVPAGTFMMGSPEGEGEWDERPRREVSLSAFRIQRHEVTHAEYRRFDPEQRGDDDLPAAYLTWYASYAYAAWLGGRLPTEAEWEYAARAGCSYAYGCTKAGKEATADAVAWTLRNSRRGGRLTASAVMQLEPNPWGLYDLSGNLWEWTADWYAPYPEGSVSDPWGPVAAAACGGRRVNRGGSFRLQADRARVALRVRFAPGDEVGNQGCRVVLSRRPEPSMVDP